MIDIKELCYPIIGIDSENHILFFEDASDLTTCNFRAFRNSFYKNLIIVDSSGKRVEVKSAIRQRTLYLKMQIQVNISLKQDVKTYDIAEFKQFLILLFEKNSSFWESGFEMGTIYEAINNGKSIKDIITRFTKYYFTGVW